ncbi:MAG TPA: SDR family NAD(P)-dependent oxidoreductase [Anaerolineales bacterium]
MNNQKLLNARTALVTGGTSGIGFYTALALAHLGAVVYIIGRDPSRGRNAQSEMRTAAGHGGVHFICADASTVGGNQELARRILTDTNQLHILVNNVGGLYNDRWETDDGYEASLAMNFVSPFALTEALLPVLRESTPARIVNVSSAGYTMWKGDLFADIQSCDAYIGSDAYNRSKYLNLLWTLALARRLEGRGIVVNALHPGVAWTTMTQSNEPRILPPGMRKLWPIFRIIQRTSSPEKAARTSVFLASAPEAASITGQYFESSTRPKSLSAEVTDPIKLEKTWELGASLVRRAPTAITFGPEPVLQLIN